MVDVKVEFLGGLDSIFKNKRKHNVTLIGSDNSKITMGDLIDYIVEKMIDNKRNRDVFIQDGIIRPGILTLINDTDWELEGQKEYVLMSGDIISFTSTLHGG